MNYNRKERTDRRSFMTGIWKYWAIISFLLINITSCYSGRAYQVESEESVRTRHSLNYTIYEFQNPSADDAVVILFSPIFWEDRILWDHDYGLVPYFLTQNVKVAVVSYRSGDPVSVFSEGLDSLLNHYKKEDIYLGGLSVGGQYLLKALADNKKTGRNLDSVRGVFFLGTGMDYEYPGSFSRSYKNFRKVQYHPRYFLDSSNREYLADQDFSVFSSISLWENENQFGKIPIAFFYGKIDSVAPEESIFPFYQKWKAPKLFYEFSIANGSGLDYDHGGLFRGRNAHKNVYPAIVEWMKGE